METLRLLIADENEEFVHNLTEALQDEFRISCCTRGDEALETLKRDPPDLLVLDLLLPGLDGISLLHEMVETGLCPMIIATSRLVNDYISETMNQLGVTYLLRKPCSVSATAARIRDLSLRLHRADANSIDLKTQISNILISLGVATKHKGYTYLREAILLALDNPLQSVTKELYPAVASRCSTKPLHVEHAIRTAVASAWERRNDDIWVLYFQPEADGEIRRPSNAVFIKQLADRISLNGRSI